MDEKSTEKNPILTVSLVGINIAVFLFVIFSGSMEQIIETYAMFPKEIMAGKELHTLITSMFLHGGFLHVLFNVWYLWIFGDNIEDLFGRFKFLLIYFGAGIVASFAHIATSPAPVIGASGAIAGILGAYLVKYPREKVQTIISILAFLILFAFLFHLVYIVLFGFIFIFLGKAFFVKIIRVPAAAFIGIWIFMQIWRMFFTPYIGMQTTVAYMAHIGGFITGMILALLLGEKETIPKTKDEQYTTYDPTPIKPNQQTN